MNAKVKQVFYCFTYYDNVEKRRFKTNCNTLHGARRLRNETLADKRYNAVSDIFQDSLDI